MFQYPLRIEPLVELNAKIDQILGISKFQYPLRIEPLVEPKYILIELPDLPSFSILCGSSLWWNSSYRNGWRMR